MKIDKVTAYFIITMLIFAAIVILAYMLYGGGAKFLTTSKFNPNI